MFKHLKTYLLIELSTCLLYTSNTEETSAEFKTEFNNFKEQLTTKLEETNTNIEVLEARVEQSMKEQALKMENRFNEQKTEWSKELKAGIKQLTEHWNE